MSDAVIEKFKPTSGILATTAMAVGVLFLLGYIGLIVLVRPYFPEIDFLPDTSYLWYYWKLPEASIWARLTSWFGYLLHQVTIWYLIYYAQNNKLTYKKFLHPVNVAALAANAFFVLLHLAQSWGWYDGLAQDTPIWSSQNAVIVMLVMILLMENKRRGLFFGYRVKGAVMEESGRILRKYHGYVFSWAVIYTFWYHPMEATPMHLIGTLYTALIMLQGSLFFTGIHTNRYWMVVMEVGALFHGALVAYLNFDGTWPFFFFGFAAMFIITQMHGLGLKVWLRWGFVAAYVIGVLTVYAMQAWKGIFIVPGIPAVEFAGVFAMAVLVWGLMLAGDWLNDRFFKSSVSQA